MAQENWNKDLDELNKIPSRGNINKKTIRHEVAYQDDLIKITKRIDFIEKRLENLYDLLDTRSISKMRNQIKQMQSDMNNSNQKAGNGNNSR